jgi:hypothetical protein
MPLFLVNSMSILSPTYYVSSLEFSITLCTSFSYNLPETVHTYKCPKVQGYTPLVNRKIMVGFGASSFFLSLQEPRPHLSPNKHYDPFGALSYFAFCSTLGCILRWYACISKECILYYIDKLYNELQRHEPRPRTAITEQSTSRASSKTEGTQERSRWKKESCPSVRLRALIGQ